MKTLTKICSKCNIGTDFYIAHTGVRSAYCKACMRVRSLLYAKQHPEVARANHKKWRLANPEKQASSVRFSNMKRLFGIGKLEYNALYLKQNGCCALCSLPESIIRRSLAVDHSHSTGKIRGLLCFKCNTALGKFGDNPELLMKAAKYVTEG